MTLALGIDFGTTGARAIAIDAKGTVQAEAEYAFNSGIEPLTQLWETALFSLFQQLPLKIRYSVKAIAINGTSSTVLLCDATGQPVSPALLYNDPKGADYLEYLKTVAPPHHTVLSATSSLVKLLWFAQHYPQPSLYFLHQADWLAFLLHGKLGLSDDHNALKLGYDVEQACYPAWFEPLKIPFHLPEVITPGTEIAPIQPQIAREWGFTEDCSVYAGTTDSIAAFLASGANSPGEAVTSLGSTLVVKLLSTTRVEDSRYGIYSHRLGNLWLVGGASNTGGAVLRKFFTDEELATLSPEINPQQESELEYYPLLQKGDRFPINDPTLPPRLEPRPANPREFLHGLLESIARIETQGYHLLQQLGASPLTRVYTAGGGAKNPVWTAIRARRLQVPLVPTLHPQAAYGTARLAFSKILEKRG